MICAEAHGVFLHALCGPFDVTQLRPVIHVIIIHCRAPAKHIVFDEKLDQHGHDDVGTGDAHKG